MTTGYLTVQDLVNLKITFDALNATSSQIKDLLEDDLSSDAKVRMSEGAAYYDAEHDILDHKHYYYLDGVKIEDTAKANNRVTHPFHKILVDQKVSYIAGNPVVVAGDDEAMVDTVLEEAGEWFDDLLNDWLTGSANKGVEWIHFYVGPDGELHYVIVPAEGVLPVYDTQYQDDLIGVIRYYTYQLVDVAGESYDRYKVEWWTKERVAYYVQIEDESYILDPDYNPNPRTHFEAKNDALGTRRGISWGRVPFVPLYNNSGATTDLEPIKALIDAYDRVKSGWVNDLDDFQELILVLKGYAPLTSQIETGLSDLAVFLKNLKTHKVISVGENGGVESLKAEIPVEAKEKFLAITRKEIFYFGQGVDVSNEDFQTPSGIALKFMYANLDLKANQTIRKAKTALGEFFWFMVKFINERDKKTYDPKTLSFTFNKSVIINEAEKVAELQQSEGMLSRETLLENHPLVDDVQQELERLEKEEKDRAARGMVDLGEVEPNEPEPPNPNGPEPQE